MQFVCKIRTADERSGGHPLKAQRMSSFLPVLKVVNGYKMLNRKMFSGGLEILPDREVVAAGLAQVVQSLVDLLLRFTQPQHEAGFGFHGGASPRLFCVAEKLQRSPVIGFGANPPSEAFHGLDIVVINIRNRFKNSIDRKGITEKIRREDFDNGSRKMQAQLLDAFGKDERAAVL